MDDQDTKLRQRSATTKNQSKKPSKKEATKDVKKTKTQQTHDDLQTATSSGTHRLWLRSVVILCIMTLVYFYSKNQTKNGKFALVEEKLGLRMQKFKCSDSYEREVKDYPKCVPSRCGRFVTDSLIEPKEAQILLELAESILTKTNSKGGASILDLHSGALSYGQNFVNIYNISKLANLITNKHILVYNLAKAKIHEVIAERFDIPASSLYLTHPTFFSRLTNETAKTAHDEYWHEHVDKETYQSFHYTSLLYLNTFKKDYNGGRFIFVDGIEGVNRTTTVIEPKQGRLNAFTSGEENRHYVEKVSDGVRYAITISFTCNSKLGINDPKLKRAER